MEDFLREKMDRHDPQYPNDWSAFEEKLDRAVFFRDVRIGATITMGAILLFIALFTGSSFHGLRFSGFGEYEPREIYYQGNGAASDYIAIEEGIKDEADQRLEASPSSPVSSTLNIPKKIEANVGAASNAVQSNSINQEESTIESATEITSEYTQDVTVDEISIAASETEKPANQQSPQTAGLSMFPDGKSSSNWKLNVKPLALMVDVDDLQPLHIKPPILPVRMDRARPTPYVSPMQEKNPWSYSIKVYPNFTYRKFVVAPRHMPYIHRDFIDQVKVSESGGFSLNIGFEASKRIGHITYLNAGLEYISYKTEANFDFVNYRDAVINETSGKIINYNMKETPEQIVITDANLYHYVNLPFSISYKPWATDHVRINIEAGASYMYFVTAKGESIDYRTLEVIDISEREYRNSMGSFSMKVGATYHVSQQFSLGFEPTVVYFTNTIYTEDYPFEVIPYSVGVNFKLQMKLN